MIKSLLMTIIGTLLFFSLPASAVQPIATDEKRAILESYSELLSVPNVVTNQEDIRANAKWIMNEMEELDLSPRLLETKDSNASPAIYGEWIVDSTKKTYILYAHYDGQPANPAEWNGDQPFEPVLRSGRREDGAKTIDLETHNGPIIDDWRIYARSASDDKLGVIAILTSLQRLRKSGQIPSFNVKIFLEGEEEAGSENLGDILDNHKKLLESDGWIIVDGPAHSSGAMQIFLGVRGVTSVEVTTYGAVRGLHSGHYGNWAPGPGIRLARLLASMKATDGTILIEGFHDDGEPLGDAEKNAINSAPLQDETLMRELGIAQPDGGGEPRLMTVNRASLDILGIRSADVGEEARNVIPMTATATIGLRLVKGHDWQRQQRIVAEHIRKQGYYVINREPTLEERNLYPLIATVTYGAGYNAVRTSLDHPLATAVSKLLSHHQPVIVPTSGGSLPLSIITDRYDVPTITLSVANHDNNQHAANENLRLGNLWQTIAIVEDILLGI